MKYFIILFIWAGIGTPIIAQQEEVSDADPLVAIVEACQDALALGDKSTAFSIARKMRSEALVRFQDEPRQLAPLLLLYADAAASYKDTRALIAYREAIAVYERAFDTKSEHLIEPLLRSAREALARKFRVEAFELFQRVIEISEQQADSKLAQAAIAKTGIASLHLRVGEHEVARAFLDDALLVDVRSISPLDFGWIYHVSADSHMAMNNWAAAEEHYTQAYGLYEAISGNGRDLRTILRRLIKVSHMMGEPERAIKFCQMYAEKRDWGSRMLFDPSSKMIVQRGSNVASTATVGVEYTINSNCRAVDVVVIRNGGMDAAEVKKIVESAYWLPRYRGGVPVETGLQRISSFIIND